MSIIPIIGYDGYGKPIYYMPPLMNTPIPTSNFQRAVLWIYSFMLVWPHKKGSLDRSRYLESNGGGQRNYGWRIHPKYKDLRFHYGIDIAGTKNKGDDVIATATGKITLMKKICGDGGNIVEIQHTINGITFKSRYLHLLRFPTEKYVGSTVNAGDTIGYIGNSGTQDIHLHFEIFMNSFIPMLKQIQTQKPDTDRFYVDPLIFGYK